MSRLDERLHCLRYWCGLPFFLPMLSSEAQSARRLIKYSFVLALLVAFVPVGIVWAIAIAAVGSALLGLASYGRSWAIWDLLVWDRDRWSDGSGPRPAQGVNSETALETRLAILSRNPLRIRSAVAKVVDPTPWRIVFDHYAMALADVMESRPPDLELMEAAVGGLQTDVERAKATVMIALVRASQADVTGGDWRAPLSQCRRELRPPFSPFRWLWPCRLNVYVSVYLLVLAIVLLAIFATVRF
jgi:hypothetical protein